MLTRALAVRTFYSISIAILLYLQDDRKQVGAEKEQVLGEGLQDFRMHRSSWQFELKYQGTPKVFQVLNMPLGYKGSHC